MPCELDPGFQLNHGNKGFEHLVEQFDLLLRITDGPGDEQVGDAGERAQLLFGGPRYGGVLNFINQSGERCHGYRLVGRFLRFEVGGSGA